MKKKKTNNDEVHAEGNSTDNVQPEEKLEVNLNDEKSEVNEPEKNESGREDEEKQEYWINTWRGLTKYNCNYCRFDSFDLNALKEHIRTVHPPKIEPKQPYKAPLYDKFGNLIKNRE